MVKPELLGPKTKNLALQHKHVYHNIALADILRQEGKLPKKMLVLNFEVEDIYMKTQGNLLNQLYSLKYYYHKNDLVKELINLKGFQERIKMLSSIYRHNGEGWKMFSYPIHNNCPTPTADGYVPLIPGPLDSARLEQSLIDDFEPFNFKTINPKVQELILYLKSTCDEERIELRIIHGPYYKLHEELKVASKRFKAFCTKHNINYIDYCEGNTAELNKKELWYDNMHLNDSGASIYTTMIKKSLY
jgi:hypothetical protein